GEKFPPKPLIPLDQGGRGVYYPKGKQPRHPIESTRSLVIPPATAGSPHSPPTSAPPPNSDGRWRRRFRSRSHIRCSKNLPGRGHPPRSNTTQCTLTPTMES